MSTDTLRGRRTMDTVGGAPGMPREIGDHYFNHLFPDQTKPKPQPPSVADKVLDWVLKALSGSAKQVGEYEYKTVKVPQAKGHSGRQRKHARALERLSVDGWEVVHIQPRGVLQFGANDTVTLRRKR